MTSKPYMDSAAAVRVWAEAFRDGRSFASARHNISTDGTHACLHGNLIAWTKGGMFWISSQGWETVTTADRLNAILKALGDSGHVRIIKRELVYVNPSSADHLFRFFAGHHVRVGLGRLGMLVLAAERAARAA